MVCMDLAHASSVCNGAVVRLLCGEEGFRVSGRQRMGEVLLLLLVGQFRGMSRACTMSACVSGVSESVATRLEKSRFWARRPGAREK